MFFIMLLKDYVRSLIVLCLRQEKMGFSIFIVLFWVLLTNFLISIIDSLVEQMLLTLFMISMFA